MKWLLLILTLPTSSGTTRVRIWRTLKAQGAAALRDGVYLIPDLDDCQRAFKQVAGEVEADGGTAFLLETKGNEGFASLFDRAADFAGLQKDVEQLRAGLDKTSPSDAARQARKLRKAFTALATIDFFPGDSQSSLALALAALEQQIRRLLDHGEPTAADVPVARLVLPDYQKRLWATRQRPWVDRLASAWLIRRFIDPEARFLWLASPSDCPVDALGFDFDGAAFTHVGDKVTLEVLQASFDIQQAGLQRLAALVHYLDVGGVPVSEAAGLAAVLDGLRRSLPGDDALLNAAMAVFDSLLLHFSEQTP